MNTTMIPRKASPTDRRRHGRRFVGVSILAVALLGATACSGGVATDAAGGRAPASASTTAVSAMSSAVNGSSAVSATTFTTTTPPVPTATVPTPTVARPTATLDELVGGEGERVHVRCVGRGVTTVLLIAGFEAGAEGWGVIEPATSERARVCSYDRPGTGTSDPPTSTQTFATQATDLHELLTTIGEPGPYVVVGHSFGGAEAVMFASLYADEVTGLVLIDASPVTWPAALSAVPDDGTETATVLRAFGAGLSDPMRNSERLDVVASFAEVGRVDSLGSLPTAVLTAADRQPQLLGLAATEVARLTEIWDRGQQDWIGLSTVAHLVSVDDTGHHIEIDQSGVVIGEITRLLP
jgi:pimeloyl-ACP methyl ester carboxylesterase